MAKQKLVLCPECVAAGLTSRVFPGGSISTDMAYGPHYDEQGRYHNHDDNRVTAMYSCSRGHEWAVEVQRTCWCGWKSTTAAELDARWQEMLDHWKDRGAGVPTAGVCGGPETCVTTGTLR